LHGAEEPLAIGGLGAVRLASGMLGGLRRSTAGVSILLLCLITSAAQTQPLVVAATPDLKSLTEAVAAGAVRVETLVPPGTDPEAFEPRPSHLALVRDAALVIRVGAGFDEWLDRLVRQSRNARVQRGAAGHLDLSAEIALVEVQGRSVEASSGHAHGAANPHYWLDPANAEIMSAHIAEALTRAAPDAREAIAAAQSRFASDLKAGLARWTAALAPHRGAAVIAYHNSWPYFARRFRLNIVDVIEAKEGVPPSAARLARLAGRMREAKVQAVLHEPFVPVEASRFLAERSGARLVVLAPSVGSKPEARDYLSLFDHNVELLAAALAESP
jgi:ABC-type Zn uptake system ZnuABC Zn-binding protein ZnuA